MLCVYFRLFEPSIKSSLAGLKTPNYSKRASAKKASSSSKIAISKWVQDHLKKACGLEETANDLEFIYGKHGKPYLKDFPLVFFNLSHSKDAAILAISSQEVGIDIEWRTPSDKSSVLNRFFSLEEQEFVNLQREGDFESAFLYLWTCKESLFKYIGCGISNGLGKYNLSFKNKRARASYNSQALCFHSKSERPYLITLCSPITSIDSYTNESQPFINALT